MKEVVLKAFKELGPCGIRTVVNAIQEEHAEVKTLTHKLATAGLLFMQSNMQFRITDAGLAELEKLQKAPAQVPTETDPVPIPEKRLQIAELLRGQQLTQRQIAKQLKTSLGTVSAVANEIGFKRKTHELEPRKAEVEQLLQEGLTSWEIAERMGVKQQNLRHFVRLHCKNGFRYRELNYKTWELKQGIELIRELAPTMTRHELAKKWECCYKLMSKFLNDNRIDYLRLKRSNLPKWLKE